MPQSRKSSSQKPPKTMTWAKATPVLIISIIFDFIRFIFEWFWFFAPALGAIACTAGVNSFVGTTIAAVGGKAVAAGCTVVAGVAGFFGFEPLTAFGTMMAMAVGLLGWLTVLLIIMIIDSRMFTDNPLSFMLSLGVSEVPIIGSIPAITIITFRVFRAQIKRDKVELKKYNESQTAAQAQERNQKIAQFMQARSAQDEFTQEKDANEEEIPDEIQDAA